MKILLQRVAAASVEVDGRSIGNIDRGILLLVGFGKEDSDPPLSLAAGKLLNLRIFANADGKLDHSLLDIGGEILAVPQFTLYGQARKGRRPDFTEAQAPELAAANFDSFIRKLEQLSDKKVQTGVFGANMQVNLCNDGPFTLLLNY